MEHALNQNPVGENDIVVHIPKGTSQHIKIQEQDPKNMGSEIVVQVSKKRKSSTMPVLGVIVK